MRNIGASVRQRLLNLAHARGQPMVELLLTRYALERLLHRLSVAHGRPMYTQKHLFLIDFCI